MLRIRTRLLMFLALSPILPPSASCVAAECPVMVLEYATPIPASPGSLGSLATDGDRIWISQGTLALRYTLGPDGWTSDGFLSDPGVNDPTWLSAASGRVLFGRRVYAEPDGFVESTFLHGGPYCDGPPPTLFSDFVAYGYNCLNFFAKGAAQAGYGASIAAPEGLPFQQAPGYRMGSIGNTSLICTAGYNGSGPLRVRFHEMSGNASAAQLVSTSGTTDGPLHYVVHDLEPTADGLFVVLSGPTGFGAMSLACWDGTSWRVHAGAPMASSYSGHSLARVGNRMFLKVDWDLHEVTAPAGGGLDFEYLMQIPHVREICGGESVLAAMIDDPDVPSGTGLAVYRLRVPADCNANGSEDCEEIADGSVADLNSNGIPDSCELDPCPGDITGGGVVNGVDLAAILAAWGTDGQGKQDCDLNDDATVDAMDLSVVLAGWGPCPD